MHPSAAAASPAHLVLNLQASYLFAAAAAATRPARKQARADWDGGHCGGAWE